MTKTPKAGRNDRCPCGSGRKFKKCCEVRATRRRLSNLMIALVAAAVLGGLAFAFTARDEGTSTPGAGRVWSAEHGHWH
jgi:hypothetical protein